MKYFFLSYLAVVVVLSLVTFAVYGFDKRRARMNGRRVPEKTLHLLAVFGGWPGAATGQQFFRHKTHKRAFRIVFWMCVVLHVAVVGAVFYEFQSLR